LDPHVLAMAGAGLAAFDDPDAETALRAAALSGPELPMARLHYGAYLAREGMHDEALEHLRAAVELAPEDPAMHAELGAALVMTGDLEEGARALDM
ncbi:MAG: tetratricopeptide repeat protein, partial [Gemmatimonadetes bacterium]|nr:tetratricopeptide repeat protein [Gemmatimonadota bacterium]NIX48580.1 tetratricopeptide repeat protein [Gemmatimonadota bacterium]NIY11617.1 tetratricopeptide repeat protein [Gemmatimonadota bacterium]